MTLETKRYDTHLPALSVEETMEAVGIRRTKLYGLINSGELPARKIGRRTLILREDVDAFLRGLPRVGA